ncbi:MAG: hypothetical protein JWL76_2414 [Thermoleophilia bacterium]|nr:hypothetical protein [Thermoleophilia bacterium]
MPIAEPIPHALVRRAAAIARGPHACPTCECPTFAEPPVPWTDLRDYVVRCHACERPISVRVDRDRVLRRNAMPRHVRLAPDLHDPVAELLDTRGRRAFAMRVLAALALPILAGAVALQAGAAPLIALALATLVVLPSSLWGPALLAMATTATTAWARRIGDAIGERLDRTPRQESTIEVAPGRWDQWLREEKLRQRERHEHPDAVLRELERVLDERELRRVRALAEHGEVPFDHLDDLLRFRRTWTTVA